MRKIILFLGLILFLSAKNYGQVKPDSASNSIDSMAIMNDLLNLLDSSDKAKSYVNIELGLGNRLFSIRNNALNSKQQSVHTIIYSPSIGYFHKSGFSISAGANLLKDSTDAFGVNQYSISPAFELQGNDNIGFGVSYAHYFVQNKFSSFASPVQNDLYSFFKYKKPWLQPGIALGFSGGQYKQNIYKDSTIGPLRRFLYDSLTIGVKIFSLTASVGHDFDWYGLFNANDGLLLSSSFMLNMGSNQTKIIEQKTNASYLYNRLTKKGKIPKVVANKFAAESVGFSMVLDYSIGKFTFEPQLYLDYYLPKTDTQQFTSLFSFTVSCAL